MPAPDDDRRLWRIGRIECWMVSCCSGAELQVRDGESIVLRELYPTHSDVHERARALKQDYERAEKS
jgi:hypothetical protein